MHNLLLWLCWLYDVDFSHWAGLWVRIGFYQLFLWVCWLDLIYRCLMTLVLDDAFWGTLSWDRTETILPQWQRRLSHARPHVAVPIGTRLAVSWVAVWVASILPIFMVELLFAPWDAPGRYESNWVCLTQVYVFFLQFCTHKAHCITLSYQLTVVVQSEWNWHRCSGDRA